MINYKKLLLITLCVTMIFSSIPVLGAEEAGTFLEEDFNSDITGDMPVGSFKAQKAGGAEIGVVEVPDAKNKSVYLRGADGGTASMTASVVNPDALPLTLSFRFMLSSATNTFYVRIGDSAGTNDIVMSISDCLLSCGEKSVEELNPRVWYLASLTFNLSQQSYRFALDGETVMDRFKINAASLDILSLEATGNNSGVYLDDIKVTNADVGGPDREWWPSAMWTGDAQQLVVDDISLGNFTMFQGSTVAYKNGEKLQMPAPVREIDGVYYVPLRFAAEKLGAEVVWNGVENAVYMMFLGKTIKISMSDGKVYTDGVETAISNTIKSINGTTYISAQDLGALLEQEVNSADGFIMFGPDWDYYNSVEDSTKKEIYRMVKYQRPDGETVYNTLLENNPNKEHPRIMARAEDFERLKTLYENQSDEFLNKAFNYIITKANKYVNQEPTKYVNPSQGVRQHSARKVPDIVYTCIMAYKITGDIKYSDRAKAEIMNIVTVWPELGENATLDLGDNSEMLGVAYDWLYDEWTDEEKALIRNDLKTQIMPVLMACYRGDLTVYPQVGRNWINNNGNFNSHLNTGITMALLAMGDDFDNTTVENEVKPILKYALRSVEDFIDEWYPDGAWFEGPGYGEAVIGQMAFLFDTISTACGTDFGFNGVPGIFESNLWSLYVHGSVAPFNYSDSWESNRTHQQYFWASEVLDENIFTAKRIMELEDGVFGDLWPIELVWYDPSRVQEYVPPEEPDKYFRRAETAMMRSGWEKNDWYAGIHAGENGITHSHIDTGTIILDWGGTRWIKETGVDDATYTTTNNPKGTFYRQRAEGHNTIVIDETPYVTWEAGEWPIIFEDDFEAETVGSDPSGWRIVETNNDPNGQGEMGIANVEYIEKDGNEENKALHLEKKFDGKLRTGFHAERIFGAYGKVSVEKAIDINFKYKLDSINQDAEFGMDYVTLESSNGATHRLFCIRKKENSKEYVLNARNGSSEVKAAVLDPTKWYDIKVRFEGLDSDNIADQKINIWIDGKQVATDFLPSKLFAGIYNIKFTSYGDSNLSNYIDDLVIRVHPDETDLAHSSARLYDQTLVCNSPVTDFVSKPKGSYAIVDMSDAYTRWASSANRGIMLTSNRNAFVVRDEVTLRKKSDFYWFAHSAKKNVGYEVSEDGKSVIMKALSGGVETGARMWAGIISDTPNAKFEIMECDPLPGSPTPSNQADNSALHKIAVKLEGVEGNVSLAVAFVPLEPGQTVPDNIPTDAPLSQWSIPDGEIPTLDTVTLNGVEIENFDPTKTNYNISVTEDMQVPVVGAVYNGQALEVSQPQSLYDSATFSLQSGGETIDYKVSFFVQKLTYAYIQGHPISDNKITASSTTAEENGPTQIIDKNMETSCSSLGDGEYVQFDFSEPRDFSKIEIAWRWGEGRNYKFDLLYSNDAINWETAYTGQSSGLHSDYELYEFGKTVTARYLKLVGHGNNVNFYNNMLEIR